MKVTALDLSLTGTGIARIIDGDAKVSVLKTKSRGHERLWQIMSAAREASMNADLVLVEGPSFGSQGSAYHQLAGLWWIVAHALHHDGRNVAVVPPSSLKKYATGKGNAPKDAVLMAVTRRWPDIDCGDNNGADALVMAAMGARHLGEPIDSMPAAHLAAMDKVEWPAAAALI